MKEYHISGHASKKNIKWAIETINPDVIIPVHTDNHCWFNNNFDNAVPIKESYTLKF